MNDTLKLAKMQRREHQLDVAKDLLMVGLNSPIFTGLLAIYLNHMAGAAGVYKAGTGDKSMLGGPVWFEVDQVQVLDAFIIAACTAWAAGDKADFIFGHK
jgi:hypothetical protein